LFVVVTIRHIENVALGDNIIGELLYVRVFALEHRDFDAALVIEVRPRACSNRRKIYR
jgi:hypothetical protein